MPVKKNCKKISAGHPRVGLFFVMSPFFIFKNQVLASRPPKMTSDKKVKKTKNLPLDEIHLEHVLRFKLQPQIGALRQKTRF